MKTDSVLSKLLLASCIVSVLAACGNNASNVETSANTTASAGTATLAANVALQHMAVDSYQPPASTEAKESPIKSRDLTSAPVPVSIVLGAPLASQGAAMQQSNEAAAAVSGSGGLIVKPLKIGFGRFVAQTNTAAATQQVLKWQTTASGGQVAAINFVSTGAKGIRLGLLVTQLPETATLRYYAKGATTAFEVKGADVLKVLATNLAAGDKSDAGRTYWAPSIDAANATLEIELPMGISSSTVNVAVPQVMHMTMSTDDVNEQPAIAAMSSGTDGTKIGATCQVDVTCETTLPAASNATAHLYFLVYEPNGLYSAFTCSGTLLNDSISSGTPYLLTANHCISTQTVASNLYSKFQYRSKVCNVATNYTYFDATPFGAKLLYTAYSTDSTLLQLNGKPASPTILYVGWDATPAIGTVVHNIHHPWGTQQRISRGKVERYALRYTDTAYGIYNSDLANGHIVTANLTYGVVQGGSSGSGLFSGTDSNPKLIGSLLGALDEVCKATDPTKSELQWAVYGRFDAGYKAGMSDSLSPKGFVHSFYNAAKGINYYTINVAEKNDLKSNSPSLSYEGTTFQAETMQKTGLSPVHRFYNTSNGSYFYTISEKERAAVASNTPRMRYDGVVWYASAKSAGTSTQAVYSAFNKKTGSQFFTTSLTTRSSLITANPQFITDGIAFYVTP